MLPEIISISQFGAELTLHIPVNIVRKFYKLYDFFYRRLACFLLNIF